MYAAEQIEFDKVSSLPSPAIPNTASSLRSIEGVMTCNMQGSAFQHAPWPKQRHRRKRGQEKLLADLVNVHKSTKKDYKQGERTLFVHGR